jgi:hypothetical protein
LAATTAATANQTKEKVVMKRSLKFLGLTVAAVLAISAMAVASASAAAPEYVLSSGTFPVKFTSTSGAGVLETTTHETVNCTSDTNAGEIVNSKEGNVVVTFKGCTTTFFGFPISCNSSGKASGEIVTNKLTSTLEYNVGKTKVLNLLSPPSGGASAEFTCAGNTVKVTGGVLGEFPTTNTFLHSTSLVLKQTGGKQEFREYVNAAGTTLSAHLSSSKNGGTAVESGEETTDTITLEGTRELKITK